jgi:Ca2+-dependent lipid-binding protein
VNVNTAEPQLPDFKLVKGADKVTSLASGELVVNVIGAKGLPAADFTRKSDPYCEVHLSKGEKKTITTKVIDDTHTPVWNHHDSFKLNMAQEELSSITLKAKV